jgi:hypothetical protein
MKCIACVLTVALALSLAPQVRAQPITLTDAGSTIAFSGNQPGAPIILRPKLTDGRTIGVWIVPAIGATTSTSQWLAAYNLTLGTDASPIPSGVKGQLSGYEANIVTAQRPSDLLPGDSGHAYGATVRTRGGAMMDLFDGVLYIEGQPANAFLHNIALVKNVPGGTQYGLNIQSTGSQPGDAALHVTGNWTVALDCEGKTVYRASQITFASPGGKNTPWSITADNGALHIQCSGQDAAWLDSGGNLHLKGNVVH